MLSGTPGSRLCARLYRARRVACACMERIGTFPSFKVLGALCQIQGYTLHLAALAFPPSCFRFQSLHFRAADYALLGEAYPLSRAPPRQATIARLPHPAFADELQDLVMREFVTGRE